MLWPFREAKNESLFCIISLEKPCLRIMYLGFAFAQVEGNFAIDFNGNSQRASFSGDTDTFLKLFVFDFTQHTGEKA